MIITPWDPNTTPFKAGMIGEIRLKKLYQLEVTPPFSKIFCICAHLSRWRHNGHDNRVSQIRRVHLSLLIGSLHERSFPDRWSRGTETLGTSLLAFQWKPPTSLSARTICDITGDFDLIWYSVRVYRPVFNFSNFDLQVWFVILDKQLHWGLVHTTSEKFENAALFLRLGLPSTLIRHENGRSSNENTAGFVF